MKSFSLFLFGLLVLVACKNQQGAQEKVPTTPKEVSLKWQGLLNNDQFAEAKRWSAPNAVEWLDWIDQKIPQEERNRFNPPLFIEGNCVENGNQANCVFLMEDNGERYQDSISLVKIEGKWLVDIPKEDLIEDASIEQLFEEIEAIEQILNEAESPQ
ncbi:MAG: hypothetical protein AAF985_22265 [Bacteroidota bacterium]